MNDNKLAAFPMSESAARALGLLRADPLTKLTPADHAANLARAQAKRERKAIKLARIRDFGAF